MPLALVNETWLQNKKIILLEPRRLATQRAAAYMASLLHEKPGGTVGYTIRGERQVSGKTRIEVVTEGVLTRMLQDDPELRGTGIVIFDEFHERSIHADLGLALTLDVQEHLRNDLKILVMSATLDGIAISALFGNAPVIQSEGRVFPIDTHYLSASPTDMIERSVVAAIIRTLKNDEGDVLVFLPGQREIRRVASSLETTELPENVIVHSLYGEAPSKQQQAALSPGPVGRRKVILSTSIAETSLTIDGVRVVIDSGFSRIPKFDPRRGMSGLVTVPVSQANAEQRRGRAGRQQPGICYRLWTEQSHHSLQKFLPPEILSTDLAPLALELARWGTPNGKGLRFLDVPPEIHLAQATELLQQLGAIDANGTLTPHGRAMAELPVHPRLAHMLIRGKELGCGTLACDIAALLEERDLLRGESDTDTDLHSRWHVLQSGKTKDRNTLERVRTQASRLKKMVGAQTGKTREEYLGLLLALAYPERIAKRRNEGSERYQMANGTGAVLPKSSMLSREQYLAIGEVDGVGSEVKVFLAAPISEDDINLVFGEKIVRSEEIFWDEKQEAVVAREVTTLGAIELRESKLSSQNDKLVPKMIEGIRMLGIDVLPWTKEALSLQARSEWLRKRALAPADWRNLSAEYLLATLEEWLTPYLTGITKRTQLTRLDMTAIIRSLFSFPQLCELDELAPTHLVVPTGSRIPLDYSSGEQPVLAVRLQEMFGETETPTVARGRVRVLLHLLSPAHRPLAVTQDLPSFWKNAYPDVRKDMRGRYPKHYWPENPLEAEPTRRAKRAGQ